MKIEISITKENKDKVLKLLDELVEAESSPNKGAEETKKEEFEVENQPYGKYFNKPINYPKELVANQFNVPSSDFGIGRHFLFNSFFAAKAMLRAIANLAIETNAPVEETKVLEVFYKASKARKLQNYNGFPNEREKIKYQQSQINKALYSLIIPLNEMGFLRRENGKLLLTQQGLNFAVIENPKLDKNIEEPLSEEEIRYLISYLKEIDNKGYKEFSFLKNLLNFIKEKKSRNEPLTYQDLVNFVMSNQKFVDFFYNNTKFGKKNRPKSGPEFAQKLKNAAQAAVSARVTLLREFKILADRKGKYDLIGDIW